MQLEHGTDSLALASGALVFSGTLPGASHPDVIRSAPGPRSDSSRRKRSRALPGFREDLGARDAAMRLARRRT